MMPTTTTLEWFHVGMAIYDTDILIEICLRDERQLRSLNDSKILDLKGNKGIRF